MSLSIDLAYAFAKITNDKKETKSEATLYGTVEVDGETKYVRLDGSEILTPASFTTDAKDGDRVTVLVKNHTATVTGNITSPSVRVDTMNEAVNDLSSKIEKNLYVRLTGDGLVIGVEGENTNILITESAVNVLANNQTYSQFAANYVQFGNYQLRKSSDGGLVFKTKE